MAQPMHPASYHQAQNAATEQMRATVSGCQRAYQLRRRHEQVVRKDATNSLGNRTFRSYGMAIR